MKLRCLQKQLTDWQMPCFGGPQIMISMNLNDCRQKDRDRAEIAAAMARSNIKPTQARQITGLLISTGRSCCLEVLITMQKRRGRNETWEIRN